MMHESPTIRLGTRGSDLALWQAETVMDLLSREASHREVDIITLKTTGDVITDRPIDAIGRTAVFTVELDRALQDKDVDIAVHSLKDVETKLAEGLVIAAVLPRGPVEDVLLGGKTLAELPAGAKIGTGSIRRKAQILQSRPDLDVRPIRGNVPTRLKKLETDDYDALVMARAGLVRLGYAHEITEVFGPETMMHAVGQGAVTVMCREDDEIMRRILAGLNHALTAHVVTAERACLAAIGGGCNVPLGVSFRVEGDRLVCRAGLYGATPGDVIFSDLDFAKDDDPEVAGRAVAENLRSQGGDALVASHRAE